MVLLYVARVADLRVGFFVLVKSLRAPVGGLGDYAALVAPEGRFGKDLGMRFRRPADGEVLRRTRGGRSGSTGNRTHCGTLPQRPTSSFRSPTLLG